MLVRTDDEVYRVDAVWLGPPRATFPWRARYVSYGVGLLVMMLIMMIQRRLGIGLDFFSVAWALVGTVAVTRFLGKKIDYERPLGQVLAHFWAEVTGPRAERRANGGPVRARHVRIQSSRAQPAAALRAGTARPRPWKVPSRPGAVPAPRPVTAGAVPGSTDGRLGAPVPATDASVAERVVSGPGVVEGGGPADRDPAGRDTGHDSADRAADRDPDHAPDQASDRDPDRDAADRIVIGGSGVPDPDPGSARPRRVVPPLPEPVSAPKRGRFRAARGRVGKRGRGAAAPARTRQPDPWRNGGHRGRT